MTERDDVENVVSGVTAICHTAAWTRLSAHREEERRYFFDPTTALIDAATHVGVERYIWDSSDGSAIGHHEPGHKPGCWPMRGHRVGYAAPTRASPPAPSEWFIIARNSG
ncbi:MAG TPA: hypothetical protein ENI69_04240 [Rhodospirillales bacterium]|nr:hypothetical protein [Rhodospirillales bacterium]